MPPAEGRGFSPAVKHRQRGALAPEAASLNLGRLFMRWVLGVAIECVALECVAAGLMPPDRALLLQSNRPGSSPQADPFSDLVVERTRRGKRNESANKPPQRGLPHRRAVHIFPGVHQREQS